MGGAIDPVFQRKKFLLRQKHFALNEKYYVWDEAGKNILFIERPVYFLKGLLAVAGGLGALGLVVALFIGIGTLLGEKAMDAMLGIGALLGFIAFAIVATLIQPKRHVTVYRDESKAERLMSIEQDQKFAPMNATYTVKDVSGAVLATLKKNYLVDIFRKRWVCASPTGETVSVIKEDSILMAILRRFVVAWKTNFIILKGESEEVIGEFIRKMTLLDRYVLDMSRDTGNHVDPRVALAIGVMLDTGERR